MHQSLFLFQIWHKNNSKDPEKQNYEALIPLCYWVFFSFSQGLLLFLEASKKTCVLLEFRCSVPEIPKKHVFLDLHSKSKKSSPRRAQSKKDFEKPWENQNGIPAS